jgi:zinc transport system ATP-binding protein
MNLPVQSCDYKGHGGLCCTQVVQFGVTIGSETVLENVNLHIHCGELTAIIGPNGAGKSTLLKALIGLLPHSGELHYLDAKHNRTEHPLFGYVPQDFSFDRDSPVSVLDFMVACHYRFPVWLHVPKSIQKRIEKSLHEVGADQLLHKKLGVLSGGELQRVLLALALDPVPNILLLDEPVSGVDQSGTTLFYQLVSDLRKQYDLSILLVSHDLDYIEQIADRVILLNKTVLLNDTPVNVFSSQEYRVAFSLKDKVFE